MRLDSRLVESLRALGVLRRGVRLLVACSGGLDSTVLAHACAEITSRWGGSLALAYIHHGLRLEADAEEETVRRFAATHGAAFLTARVDVTGATGEGTTLQDVARRLRYDSLELLRVQCGADWILTAHHADDQAETLLMRFARGTGPDGLCGIRPVRGRIVRPLLFARRGDLERYASDNSLLWCEDSSNESDNYARNAVRRHVFPVIVRYANPAFSAAMRDTAALFSSMAEFHEQEARRLLGECAELSARGVLLAVQPIRRYLDYQQLLVIRSAVRLFRAENATYDETRAVQKLLGRRPGSTALLKGACIAMRERDHLVIASTPLETLRPMMVALGMRVVLPSGTFQSEECARPETVWNGDPRSEVADLGKTGTRWLLRPWHTGDSFQPVNSGFRKNVSELFTEMRIPRSARSRIPILEANGVIVWICGVRLDDRFKVTAETTTTVRFDYRQEQE